MYTKRFIDQELRRLGQPLATTSNLERILSEDSKGDADGGQLSEKQLQQIIGKVNVLIKRYNRNIFPKQVVNQIIQQVIKCEQNKLMIVSEKLMRIELILKPILLPEVNQMGNVKMLMGEFGELVGELPESKYLFDEEDDDTGDEEEGAPNQELSEDDHILVQDEQERVDDNELTTAQYRRLLKQQTKQENLKSDDAQVLQQYDEIRHRLIELHHGLEYKYAKLEYLTQLKEKLLRVLQVPVPQPVRGMDGVADDEPFDSDDEANVPPTRCHKLEPTVNTNLSNEINKFRVLVEKIAYRLHSKEELQAALDSINTD